MAASNARNRWVYPQPDDDEENLLFRGVGPTPSAQLFDFGTFRTSGIRQAPAAPAIPKGEPWTLPPLNSIINKRDLFNLAIGVAIGAGGMTAKAFAQASGGGFLIAGAAFGVGLAKGIHKAHKEDWYGGDWKKSLWELGKSTALTTGGSLFAMFAIPFVGEVYEKISAIFNHAPSIPPLPVAVPEIAAPSVRAPLPVVSAPEVSIPEAIPAPAVVEIPKPEIIFEADADANIAPPPLQAPVFEMPESPQAQKDLAVSLLSGPNADPARAVQLYESAAAAGNTQAKFDLLYLKVQEMAGFEGTRGDAIEAMRAFAAENAKAADFMAQLEPVNVVPDIAPEEISAAVAPAPALTEGQELSIQFETMADGSFKGTLINGADIPEGTVIADIPVVKIR